MIVKQTKLREEVNAIINNFGKLIKEIRHEKKWSMAKLEKESGISQSLISDLENNKGKMPNIFTLVSIARALDFSDETFIEYLWGHVPTKNTDIDKNKKLEQALLNVGVSPKQLEGVMTYIDFTISRG